MKSRVTLLSLSALLSATGWVHGQPKPTETLGLSDTEIRLLLIRESIASYGGACPCPESRNSRGARCGGNSAYSRPGGTSPLCYPKDVTDAMIKQYRDALAKQ
jgi:hypothetical protein